MVTFQQFALARFQVAAFRVPGIEFNASRLLATVLGAEMGRFNGPVQAFPLPAEMPAEVPRISLKSKDGAWKFNASVERLDVIFVGDGPQDMVQQACRDIIIGALDGIGEPASRLATIAEYLARVESPQAELIETFCKAEAYDPNRPQSPLRNSRAFELHNLKRYTLPRFNGLCNSWVRCSADTTLDGQGRLTVKLDINTLSEERAAAQITIDRQRAFYEASAGELTRILELYFPRPQ